MTPPPHAHPPASPPPALAPAIQRMGLIGCGLMGGSFALALKQAGLVRHITGYSLSPTDMQQALELGVIDTMADSPAHAAQDACLVLLAVPVAATQDVLTTIRTVIAPHALVMDIGSTKVDVVHAARQALREQAHQFVPAHPITGREVSGVAHAAPQLYRGARVILTPDSSLTTPCTLPRHELLLQQAESLWQALGCHVIRMPAAAHDAALAAVSHLPHLLAFAMMRGMLQQPEGQDWLTLAGPGFRDATRIAASAPAIWRDILLANRREVLRQARHLRHAMEEFEAALAVGDGPALQSMITQASMARAGCNFGQPPRQPAPGD